MKAPSIDGVSVKAYRVPTERPESDGTYAWDATTLVAVHVSAGGERGFGYTYADASTATLIRDKLGEVIRGRSALDIPGCWTALSGALRNLGQSGAGMLAVAAVDSALWDLKARLLEVPLVGLLGGVRGQVDIYGSGGFTSYTISELQRQLSGWIRDGMVRVKMKVGTDPATDPERVRWAREAIGTEAELFVDANGAYSRKQALAMAEEFQEWGVTWFEEPVVSHDREGLHMVRERVPPGMEVAAGEYGFVIGEFLELLQAGCVDVLQADATRCGITGFLQVGALCDAWHIPMSSHCAPALHLHLCCAVPAVRHLEYFHDHVLMERMLFEGVVEPFLGTLAPDLERHGLGISLKEEVAQQYEL